MQRFEQILSELRVSIQKTARILDYGCGSGAAVYQLLDRGYSEAYGCDVQDYLVLRSSSDRSRFHISSRLDQRLPYGDDSFDLVISDQVFEHVIDQASVLSELYRIMRPGGHALHIFPARYRPIEGHIFVPFGGVFGHRWWYKLWALLGIRNEYQRGLSANETADRNASFFVQGLNYVPNSCYEVVWRTLGYDYKFAHQEYFDSHNSSAVRALGKLNRIVPLVGWMYRTFHERHVYLRKPLRSERP